MERIGLDQGKGDVPISAPSSLASSLASSVNSDQGAGTGHGGTGDKSAHTVYGDKSADIPKSAHSVNINRGEGGGGGTPHGGFVRPYGAPLQSASPGTPTMPVPAEQKPAPTTPQRRTQGDMKSSMYDIPEKGGSGKGSMSGTGYGMDNMTGPGTMAFGMSDGVMGCGYGDNANGGMMMQDVGHDMGMDHGMVHDYGMKGCGMKGGTMHGMSDDMAAGKVDGMFHGMADFGGKGVSIGGMSHYPAGACMMSPSAFAMAARPFSRPCRPVAPSGPPPRHLMVQQQHHTSSSSRTMAEHDLGGMLSKSVAVPKFAVMSPPPQGWQPYPPGPLPMPMFHQQ